MNGPTLRTVREALGLSVPWFARFCNVQERTVRHWESGRNTVPIAVAAAVRQFEKASADLVAQIVDQVRRIIAEHGLPTKVLAVMRYADDRDLNRYQPNMAGLPVTFHASAIARARWTFEGTLEIEARVLDAGAYEAWRRSINQEDSLRLRMQFVAMD
jgi:transcriptional regulator with XRE-family HTH domain